MTQDTPRQRADKRLAMLKNERSQWEAGWRELSDYILPMRSKFLLEKGNGNSARDRRNSKIINNTATMAARTLSSGMMSGITSPSRPWFQLSTTSQQAMEYGPVKNWLYEVTQRMRDVFTKSNLYNVLPVAYMEMGTFGTGAISVEEDDEEVVRFDAFTVGQYYLANGPRGTVDTFYREFQMTVAQMVEKFGRDKCSEMVKDAWDNNRRDQWIDCVQAIEPNKKRDPSKRDTKNLPFLSITYEKSQSDPAKLLEEKGFHEMPVMAPRWDLLPEDSYGTGPGRVSMGDVKALQLYERRSAELVDRGSNPPLQAPSSLRGQPSSTLPGGITYVDQVGGQNQMAPIYVPDSSWLIPIKDKIQTHEDRINKAFFADLFLMIAQLESVRTATEIAERKEEKMLMLGPVLERINDELLDPLIDRVFNIMLRQSLPIWEGRINGEPMLPPPPEEIAGLELKVEYVSILAQAQKSMNTTAIERFTAFAGNLAGVSPEVLDKVDIDQVVDEYAEALGVVPTVIRGDDQVEQIRQSRAQQQQAQQMADQMGAGIQGAKLLSETEVTPTNALGQMLGA